MSQVWHIFRKDTRQFWPEISSALILVILFAWVEPLAWTDSFQTSPLVLVLEAYPFLVGVSWVVLILRLIQAERLVGLNQFWTTRPYEWPKLLAAKCLALAAYIYVPLTLVQIVLLQRAGFVAREHIGELLLELVTMTAVLILPVLCVAVVTAWFPQANLVMLGGLVALSLFGLSRPGGRGLPPSFQTTLIAVLELALFSAALVFQYRRRRTRITIVILLFSTVILVAIEARLPGTRWAVTGFTPGQGRLALRFDPNPLRTFGKPVVHGPGELVVLRIPMLASSGGTPITENVQGKMVRLEGADGYRWHSEWQNAFQAFQTEETDSLVYGEIVIPLRVYERLSGGPVKVAMLFAVLEMEPKPTETRTLMTTYTSVSGLGVCRVSEISNSLECLSPYHAPSSVTFTGAVSINGCLGPTQNLVSARGALGWPTTQWSADPGISPIEFMHAWLSPETKPQPGYSLCPGATMKFTPSRVARQVLVDMPETTVELKDYAGTFGPHEYR